MMGVRSSVLLWLPLAAWMAVILHFSSVAQVPVPAGTDISYLHVPAYFVLATLFLRLFLKEGVRRRFPLAIIASASYGMLMESVQPMFHARTFSFLDMILNLAGSCLIIAFLSKRGERALGMLTEY